MYMVGVKKEQIKKLMKSQGGLWRLAIQGIQSQSNKEKTGN